MTARPRRMLAIVVGAAAAGWLIVSECADGGGMAAGNYLAKAFAEAGLAPKTIRNGLSILRRVYNVLEREGAISRNPASGVGGLIRRVDRAAAQETVRAALVAGLEEWGTGAATLSAIEHTGMSTLVAASSLPIREVDAHLRRPVRVIANRGASGIDGIVSTAFGVSTLVPGTLLFTGDLSLHHDSNGYLAEETTALVAVVVDNGGGGLFDSLPTARHAPSYERLFITAPRRRLADLATLHRLDHHVAASGEDLTNAVDQGLRGGARLLVEVRVGRTADLAARRRLDDLARSALEA